eukprot:1593298-Pleurochrysis_carterae.AAC.1
MREGVVVVACVAGLMGMWRRQWQDRQGGAIEDSDAGRNGASSTEREANVALLSADASSPLCGRA